MPEVVTFNLYSILKFIIILFAVFGGYSIIKDIINACSRGFKDKLDYKKKKDCEVLNCLSKKETRVITIENAQEIHEINKKVEEIENKIKLIAGEVHGK